MRRTLALLLLGTFVATGCTTLKPYEKEYLLHPLMDDANARRLRPTLSGGVSGLERYADAGAAGEGSACPTCGG